MDGHSETGDGHETMHIGVIAERTGLSQRTLRHYDDIGLVSPSQRSAGGFRLYTEEDLRRLLLIRRMKPLAFSLQEMHDLLALTDVVTGPEASEEDLEKLRALEAEAARRREDLTARAAMADEFLDRLQAISAQAAAAARRRTEDHLPEG
ncbi:MerR family transcriptional regulator [Brachybacterium sp. YJGR34]|uniref:MerR family transcriptional regulator n=1 Tax=Brachybacterium sp. YJGR34 TaxID=2059911 RepID=UPI000E0A9431|nr:MerR family transcriptional regulator [Brachybacterium sp. YJGR34]